MKKLLICISLLLFTFPAFSTIVKDSDTLLVYFSNNPKINQLYHDFIKLKFPNTYMKVLKDSNEIFQYIPRNLYNQRTAQFGINAYTNPKNADAMKNNTKIQKVEIDNVTSDDSNTIQSVKYCFFDVSSYEENVPFYSNTINSNGTRTSYTLKKLIFHLKLIFFNGKTLSERKIAELIPKNDFEEIKIIPLHKLDEFCHEINPLFIAYYLKHNEDKKMLNTSLIKNNPCSINITDTIYLCENLNQKLLSYDFKPKPKLKPFSSNVKSFKHLHIKLKNEEFASRALQHLKNNNHFYFYYFNMQTFTFCIVDALNFEIVYYFTPDLSKGFQDENQIKKFSSFSDDC
jgi:hypothetical protein